MNILERLSPADRRRVLALAELELAHARAAPSAPSGWSALARPEQLPPPGAWRTWLILAGRGWGKTRTGGETIAAWAAAGTARRIAVVAATHADVRDLSMRVLRAAAGHGAEYTESRHYQLRWVNAAEALGFSAEDPDSLRGYEFDAAWCDELAAWRYPATYDMLQFGLRAAGARQIVTTTPRPTALLRALLVDSTTVVTRGRTAENAANLDPATLRYYLSRYAAPASAVRSSRPSCSTTCRGPCGTAISSTPRRRDSATTSGSMGSAPSAPVPTIRRLPPHGISSAAVSGVWPHFFW